ncbi:MAG: hypothetical protein ACM31L_19865 [Actinomycetota bacterium]
MQIGSVGSAPTYQPTSQVQQPERAERGPDHDNDGDEGVKASASSQPAPPPEGRGRSLDVFA